MARQLDFVMSGESAPLDAAFGIGREGDLGAPAFAEPFLENLAAFADAPVFVP